jgi:hypothetical protein
MEKWIRVTLDNYKKNSEMYCEKCGEQWDFALYNLDIDILTRMEYNRPVSPCCGKHLVKKI